MTSNSSEAPARSKTPDGSQNYALWRKHFPIDTADEASRSRREFLGGAAVAGGVMACCQAALNQPANAEDPEAASIPYSPLKLEKRLDQLEVGETLLFHFPDHKSPCILVKTEEKAFVAYAQKCTHLACPVIPEPEKNQMHCPCHHGKFELSSGAPLAGPPRAPLSQVEIDAAEDGTLTATGMLVSKH